MHLKLKKRLIRLGYRAEMRIAERLANDHILYLLTIYLYSLLLLNLNLAYSQSDA